MYVTHEHPHHKNNKHTYIRTINLIIETKSIILFNTLEQHPFFPTKQQQITTQFFLANFSFVVVFYDHYLYKCFRVAKNIRLKNNNNMANIPNKQRAEILLIPTDNVMVRGPFSMMIIKDDDCFVTDGHSKHTQQNLFFICKLDNTIFQTNKSIELFLIRKLFYYRY